MNSSFRTAFRVLWLSLGLALCGAMVVVSEGIPPASRLAFAPAAMGAPVGVPAAPTGPLSEPQRAIVFRTVPPAVPTKTAAPAAPQQTAPRAAQSTITARAAPQRGVPRRATPVTLRQPVAEDDELAAAPSAEVPPAALTGVLLGPGVEPDDVSPADDVPHGRTAPRVARRSIQWDVLPQPAAPAFAATDRLEAQLARMQAQLDRLSDETIDRPATKFHQASQQLEQALEQAQQQQAQRQSQQVEQLKNLERELQGLKSITDLLGGRGTAGALPAPLAAPVSPDSTPAASPAVTGAAKTAGPITTDALEAPEKPAALKPAIMKAEQAEGNSELFSLQIKDAEIGQVLDMLGQLAGLNIIPSQNVMGLVTLNLHNVTVAQALEAILRTGNYVSESEGDFVYVHTADEVLAKKNAARKLITKVYRPQYISVKDLNTLIVPLMTVGVGRTAITAANEIGLAPNPQAAGGDRLSQQDALMVHDYPEVVAEIDAIVAEMDVPPAQVVIEAMILSVNLTDDMSFGVNFALLNGADNQMLLSGNGLQLGATSGFPGSSETITPAAGSFLADAAGLKYGFIRGDVSGFISALEKLADTNLVASPKVMVLNKQKAELIIGNRLSYKTLAFNGTQTVENVNFLDSGTKLYLRPFVAPDGLIRMEVHPELSSGAIEASTGLPNQQTTEITSNVMVRDGTTVVIGGLIEEQVDQNTSRIPFLGALPVVGSAFRNKAERTSRRELIVLITPRIVIEPPAMAEGDAARFENERRAEFFRNQLAPANRRNLARVQYERAVYHYERNEFDRARRHADAALRHNPNDREILQFRGQIDDILRERKQNWFRFPGTQTAVLPAPILGYPQPIPEELPPPAGPPAQGPR